MRGDSGDAPPLLSVRGLDAWYGRAQILFDVALEVRAGEAVALMGRNGAGKSTTLKAIMGLVPARRGAIAFDGRRIERFEPYEIARAGVGYVPEDRRIFADLTVRENLEVGRRPPRPGAPVWTLERILALFPALRELLDRPGGRTSGGEQQMLTVARTLMGNPRLLLLDEPSEGVAPIVVERMAAAIEALKAEGLALLVSEQNLPFVAEVCDRVYVLERGEVRYSGAMRDFVADEAARRAYLTV
ncbi:MAG: ABC transporter ATP-binding protein [Burkholderiales bacterium]|nr:ABC transporter ATP-binding protein [Burkholderiales bacterium]